MRASLYVDGFNLYHAIADLGRPFLKWCNLWRLAETIIPKASERLVRVVYCTAYYPGEYSKRVRHEAYVGALKTVGVDIVMGHYVHEDMACRACDHSWRKPTEKETDINLALHLYDDAGRDACDHAYLLTADSDQAATARMLKCRFPQKRLTSVSPPGRAHSKHILQYADAKIALSAHHIERAVFQGPYVMVDGKPPVRRPHEYAPPAEWIHPDRRPTR